MDWILQILLQFFQNHRVATLLKIGFEYSFG